MRRRRVWQEMFFLCGYHGLSRQIVYFYYEAAAGGGPAKKELSIEKVFSLLSIAIMSKITRAQALNVVKKKIQDMNCVDENMAINTVLGTARSMGIDYIGE